MAKVPAGSDIKVYAAKLDAIPHTRTTTSGSAITSGNEGNKTNCIFTDYFNGTNPTGTITECDGVLTNVLFINPRTKETTTYVAKPDGTVGMPISGPQ